MNQKTCLNGEGVGLSQTGIEIEDDKGPSSNPVRWLRDLYSKYDVSFLRV